MRIFILLLTFLFATSGRAQTVTGDFNGDGKNETARRVTIQKPSYIRMDQEGGYWLPGEYKVVFSDRKINELYCGDFAPLVYRIADYDSDKKQCLLLTGTHTGFPSEPWRLSRLYEYDGTRMVEIVHGKTPLTMGKDESQVVFTLNDSTWFISDGSLVDASVCSRLQCRLLYPVSESKDQPITPRHRLYPYLKKFINTPPARFTVYEIDSIPRFKDRKEKTLRDYVLRHLHYPESAKKQGIEGDVRLSFVIDTLGKVRDIKILNHADSTLTAEAKRVYASAPVFSPVIINGRPVFVRVRDMVRFQFRE